jgi:putative nucleotidyltransferase with HDIG domain
VYISPPEGRRATFLLQRVRADRTEGAVPPVGDIAASWIAWVDQIFAADPRRRAHVHAVWGRARRFVLRGPSGWSREDLAVLEMAALLHDIGRALDPLDTRPHALVGAEYLKGMGLHRVAHVVAHHTGGALEAELRGIGKAYLCWPRDPSRATAALTYLDATTGPDGERMTTAERLADVARRHGGDSVRARVLIAIVEEIEWGRALVGADAY